MDKVKTAQKPEEIMPGDLKEEFFRLDGAWASFELMMIRNRQDYLKPFRVLRCNAVSNLDGGKRPD